MYTAEVRASVSEKASGCWGKKRWKNVYFYVNGRYSRSSHFLSLLCWFVCFTHSFVCIIIHNIKRCSYRCLQWPHSARASANLSISFGPFTFYYSLCCAILLSILFIYFAFFRVHSGLALAIAMLTRMLLYVRCWIVCLWECRCMCGALRALGSHSSSVRCFFWLCACFCEWTTRIFPEVLHSFRLYTYTI